MLQDGGVSDAERAESKDHVLFRVAGVILVTHPWQVDPMNTHNTESLRGCEGLKFLSVAGVTKDHICFHKMNDIVALVSPK